VAGTKKYGDDQAALYPCNKLNGKLPKTGKL